MSKVEWEQYKESDDYTSTKPKFTDRQDRKREYCDSGWSKEGIDFYNEVWQRWKVIAYNNQVGVWSNLEEAWDFYAQENNLGNVYSRKKTRLDTPAEYDEETQQVKDLPEDQFGVLGEIEYCPWKAKRGEDDDESDDENRYGSPRKRARDGNHRLPQVSTDYDLDTLFYESEDSICPV